MWVIIGRYRYLVIFIIFITLITIITLITLITLITFITLITTRLGFVDLVLLPGYFHKIIHGDFFGGLSLNGTILDMNGVRVGVFTTHLHAEYNSENDEYLAHRVAQVFLVQKFFNI